MSSIRAMQELAALTSGTVASDETFQRVLQLLQQELSAADVFLIYGGDEGFRCFGTQPSTELSDIALWLVNRDLTSREGPCAFDVRDDRTVDFRSAGSRRYCSHVAALIPMPSRTAEMVMVRGSWPRGLGAARRRFLEGALPGLALLLDRRLDSARAERRRHQLSALANITRVMSESEDMEAVVTSIAGTIATVTGIDYISIDLMDKDGKVMQRCLSTTRPGGEGLGRRWKRGASRPDPVRTEVFNTGRPMLFADTQDDDRIPESGRNYFARTLIRSTAVFPLRVKDEVLGVLSVASHKHLDFADAEVELLAGLAAQAATAVKGIQLYQQLAESREELQRLNDQLQESMGIEHHLARTDPLTGVPNRRFIDETIEAEIVRAHRYGQPLSVIMVDLDHFKDVNDSHGHGVGDETLRSVAGLARGTCREVDVVGRVGGDEFLFVLPATELEDATVLAERFRRLLAETAILSAAGEPTRLTVSLGVAHWNGEEMNEPAALISAADRAMYTAKALGRNRTMVADGETSRAA